MKFSAVILAGGRSLRMGFDKANIKTRGRTLLEQQIETVRTAGAEEILISGRSDRDYTGFGCPVILDEFPGMGPLAGIHAALGAARHPLLLVLAVDLPEMTCDFLVRLAAGCEASRGIISRVKDEIQPLAAIYPKAAGCHATTLLRNNRCAAKEFVEVCLDHGLAEIRDFPAEHLNLFHNCNSPADLSCLT